MTVLVLFWKMLNILGLNSYLSTIELHHFVGISQVSQQNGVLEFFACLQLSHEWWSAFFQKEALELTSTT